MTPQVLVDPCHVSGIAGVWTFGSPSSSDASCYPQILWRCSYMGVPLYHWMVFVREDPIHKWMMTVGTPILGNLHIVRLRSR